MSRKNKQALRFAYNNSTSLLLLNTTKLNEKCPGSNQSSSENIGRQIDIVKNIEFKSPLLSSKLKLNLRKKSCQRFYRQWLTVVLEVVKYLWWLRDFICNCRFHLTEYWTVECACAFGWKSNRPICCATPLEHLWIYMSTSALWGW